MSMITLREWLDAHFNQPTDDDRVAIADPNLPEDYYYAEDYDPFEQDLIYTTQAFDNADIYLKPYSNEQLKRGLWYLAHNLEDVDDYQWNSVSSSMDIVNNISWDVRKMCIQSFKQLNEKLFAKRCSKYLSAYQEASKLTNPLNSICFMWWDVFAIWGSIEKDSTNRVDAEFLDVMEYCLTIDHIAVQEGALHGLNHLPNHRDRVNEIIDKFLQENPKLDPELANYAEVSKVRRNL